MIQTVIGIRKHQGNQYSCQTQGGYTDTNSERDQEASRRSVLLPDIRRIH